MAFYGRKRGKNRRSNTRISNSGYKQFKDGRYNRWVYTHRRAAENAMDGEIWDGYEVHHRNGDKWDNRPENLAVLSRKDHRYVHHLIDEVHALMDEHDYLAREVPGLRSLIRRFFLRRQIDEIEAEIDDIEMRRR
jgi:hypothetical protein